MKIEKEIKPFARILNIYKMNNNIINNTLDNTSDNTIDNKIDNKIDNTIDNTIDNKIINLNNTNILEKQKEIDKNYDKNYDKNIDFQYICIKKEHFDVNMIYLKYMNLKKENYMEIIYKSPSIYLDGLFFKTPLINSSQLSIFTKNKMPYSSVMTLVLDKDINSEFINILKTIDSYLFSYINRHTKDINSKMNCPENYYLNYETILKPCLDLKKNKINNYSREQLPYATITTGNISNKNWKGNYMITFKSYLEQSILESLKQNILNKTDTKYIITFNISNIFFSRTGLIPLIKCNKCIEIF